MGKREKFYAIRLANGDLIYDEFAWMVCNGSDDWTVAEEAEHDYPTEYEIVEMTVRPLATRTFGQVEHNRIDGECDYCGEPWPCEYVAAGAPQEDTP